jgi:hypothetical protein
MTATAIRNFLTTDHGPALDAAAKQAGRFLAILITVAWMAGDAAYDLGRQLRLAIEVRNDQLAAAWLVLLGLAREAADVVAAEPTPAPAMAALPVAAAPVALLMPVAGVTAVPAAPAPAPRPPRKRVARRKVAG